MQTKLLTLLSTFTIMNAASGLAQDYSGVDMDASLLRVASNTNGVGVTDQPKPLEMRTVPSESATEKVEKAYEEIKAALIGSNDNTADIVQITVDPRMTAKGMLGHPVLNVAGETLGNVEDIILDRNGAATAVIVSHGGVLGIGTKLAAFDYDLVMNRAANGDVVMPFSKKMVDSAKGFSYAVPDANDKTRVIAENEISVKEILKSPLMSDNEKTVAQTDNLYFSDGKASRVIFGFNQTIGIGGEKVAMNYNSLKLQQEDKAYFFKMTDKQSAQFEKYKVSVSK